MNGITKNQPYTTLYFSFFSYLFPFSKIADAKLTFMLRDSDNDLMPVAMTGRVGVSPSIILSMVRKIQKWWRSKFRM